MTSEKDILEIMKDAEPRASEISSKYLINSEQLWQPDDLLPQSDSPDFSERVLEIQDLCSQMDYDLFSVVVGDTVTEEALPTYQTWLIETKGLDQLNSNAWTSWLRAWTAEENRHGDVLNTYLYLSGRVDMREFQLTTQYLLRDGFDIGTEHNPYKSFIYTSFQELATNITHRRVATLSKKQGNAMLAEICARVASDEMRHAKAYMEFIDLLFEYDPSGVMTAYGEMMKLGIVMPGHLMMESGEKQGDLFRHFSDSAVRIGAYTGSDYIDLIHRLNTFWKIQDREDLDDSAKRHRDNVLKLPERLKRIVHRTKIPEESHKFKWLKY